MFRNKKLIFNPVVAVPWKSRAKKYEDPANLVRVLQNDREKELAKICGPKASRLRNLQLLLTRFPNLKKREINAALTLSNNKLDKAILLLEVSMCYQKETNGKPTDIAYLQNICINLYYDVEHQDPVLRNVRLENKCGPHCEELTANQENCTSSVVVISDDDSAPSKPQKVGVVIRKTQGGYKATPFNQ